MMTLPARAAHFTVNKPLTLKQRSRVIENDEYAAFVRRVIRAYSRRIAGDIEALTDLADLAGEFDTAIGQAITGLRSFGYSWADIAARLGITRQGAQQRWGDDTRTTTVTTSGSTPIDGSCP
jgi:CRP-like cAMP-binding protein